MTDTPSSKSLFTTSKSNSLDHIPRGKLYIFLCTLNHLRDPQHFLHLALKAKRRGCRRKTVNNMTLSVNKELGEIPLNAVAKQATFTRL